MPRDDDAALNKGEGGLKPSFRQASQIRTTNLKCHFARIVIASAAKRPQSILNGIASCSKLAKVICNFGWNLKDMAKSKSVFICSNCGAQSSAWIGRCPSCNEWNTLVEEVIEQEKKEHGWKHDDKKLASRPVAIHEVPTEYDKRTITADNELNRVLGGGIVPGSVILLGGEPGIGKSTLMLQVALNHTSQKILYISGEESNSQIRMRAVRLGMKEAPHLFLLSETHTDAIFRQAKELQPDILIIDSVQTLQSALIDSSAGSISQIRECAGEMQRFAKDTMTPVFLIGHITKDGTLAGPKLLEHMVDAVIQFEGDRNYGYRILRSVKNRYGSTSELGIYEMRQTGLREVSNPSEILLSQRDGELSGATVAATVEGVRPLLIEVQALVSNSAYGTAQRTANGFDLRRMNMLLAVLEKRLGFRLGTKDVFVNIAGGIRVNDPAIDLAVVCAILSSHDDVAVPGEMCFAAEIGLSGEIRPVARVENRISEAEKLGFKKIFVSSYNLKGLSLDRYNIEVIPVSNLGDIYKQIF